MAGIVIQGPSGTYWSITVNAEGGLVATPTTGPANSSSLIVTDPSGNLWNITVNAEGGIVATETTSGSSTPADNNCTITLQSVVNFASTHADLLPLSGVGGYTNEPALSLCNDALSDLISDPNDWVFNRVEMPSLFTCPNKQDYLFAGACAFTLSVNPSNNSQNNYLSQGWAIGLASTPAISVSGGIVTVTTLEPHYFPVGATVYMTGVVMTTGASLAYNSTFTNNISTSISQWSGGWVLTAVTANTFSFAITPGQFNGDLGGAPGITDFGYLTSSSMQEVNNNSSPPNIYPLTAKRELPVSSRVAIPEKVAVMADFGTGVIKIRLLWIPSTTVFAINNVYQARAPLKTALTQTWFPFPDNFAACYRQALLYRMYRYIDGPTSPRVNSEYAKLQDEIKKTQATDDAAQTDVNLQPSEPLMDASYDGMYGWW